MNKGILFTFIVLILLFGLALKGQAKSDKKTGILIFDALSEEERLKPEMSHAYKFIKEDLFPFIEEKDRKIVRTGKGSSIKTKQQIFKEWSSSTSKYDTVILFYFVHGVNTENTASNPIGESEGHYRIDPKTGEEFPAGHSKYISKYIKLDSTCKGLQDKYYGNSTNFASTKKTAKTGTGPETAEAKKELEQWNECVQKYVIYPEDIADSFAGKKLVTLPMSCFSGQLIEELGELSQSNKKFELFGISSSGKHTVTSGRYMEIIEKHLKGPNVLLTDKELNQHITLKEWEDTLSNNYMTSAHGPIQKETLDQIKDFDGMPVAPPYYLNDPKFCTYHDGTNIVCATSAKEGQKSSLPVLTNPNDFIMDPKSKVTDPKLGDIVLFTYNEKDSINKFYNEYQEYIDGEITEKYGSLTKDRMKSLYESSGKEYNEYSTKAELIFKDWHPDILNKIDKNNKWFNEGGKELSKKLFPSTDDDDQSVNH